MARFPACSRLMRLARTVQLDAGTRVVFCLLLIRHKSNLCIGGFYQFPNPFRRPVMICGYKYATSLKHTERCDRGVDRIMCKNQDPISLLNTIMLEAGRHSIRSGP